MEYCCIPQAVSISGSGREKLWVGFGQNVAPGPGISLLVLAAGLCADSNGGERRYFRVLVALKILTAARAAIWAKSPPEGPNLQK